MTRAVLVARLALSPTEGEAFYRVPTLVTVFFSYT